VVGGLDGVYEISKDFRNEGMDRSHNPEFTMLELYVAYKDYNWMMDLVEELLEHICNNVFGSSEFTFEDKKINFSRPWKRISYVDAIKDKTGVDAIAASENDLRALAKNIGIEIEGLFGKAKLIDEIFSQVVEPEIVQPTFCG